MLAVSMELKKEIHNVLCATDFSEESDKAVAFAVSLLSSERDVTIHLVHVIRPLYKALGDLSDASDLLLEEHDKSIKEAKHKIEAQAAEIRKTSFPRVHGSIRIGNPVNELLAAISEFRADLVVMGNKKRGFKKGILLGSVSERVSADSDISVLIVR